MALRLYTREEFEHELGNHLELTPTDHLAGDFRAWQTPSGKHVLVPEKGVDTPEIGERFPDFWLAEIYSQVEALDSED